MPIDYDELGIMKRSRTIQDLIAQTTEVTKKIRAMLIPYHFASSSFNADDTNPAVIEIKAAAAQCVALLLSSYYGLSNNELSLQYQCLVEIAGLAVTANDLDEANKLLAVASDCIHESWQRTDEQIAYYDLIFYNANPKTAPLPKLSETDIKKALDIFMIGYIHQFKRDN